MTLELLDADGEAIASTITDQEGHFAAVLEEAAEVYLSVSRLGYTGAVSEGIALREGTRRIEVLLPEEAIPLEPVIVVVDGRVPLLERVGFYQRAVAHPGSFIQRDDVAAVAPARTSDLLGRVPGVRVATDTSGGVIRRRGRRGIVVGRRRDKVVAGHGFRRRILARSWGNYRLSQWQSERLPETQATANLLGSRRQTT